MSFSNEEQLRSWAIEQVIKHSGGRGYSAETVVAEAARLVAFVRPTLSEFVPNESAAAA